MDNQERRSIDELRSLVADLKVRTEQLETELQEHQIRSDALQPRPDAISAQHQSHGKRLLSRAGLLKAVAGSSAAIVGTGAVGTWNTQTASASSSATFSSVILDNNGGTGGTGLLVQGNFDSGIVSNAVKEAIFAYATQGVAISAISETDAGIAADSQRGYGATITGAKAAMVLTPNGPAGPPPVLQSGSYDLGTIWMDSHGKMWIATDNTAPSGNFYPLNSLVAFPGPRRVFGQSISDDSTSDPIDATTRLNGNASGVPAGAQAAYCAVQATQPGVMTLFADGASDPGIANFAKDGTPGYLSITYMLAPLSPSGKFRIHSYLTGDVYVDVWGYLR